MGRDPIHKINYYNESLLYYMIRNAMVLYGDNDTATARARERKQTINDRHVALKYHTIRTTEWHGRAIKGKWAELAKAGVVPKKGVRDGSSDAEQVIDSIPEDQRNGKSYEQLLGRLVQYLRSGMDLEDATARLRESLMPDGEQGANPGRLAVLGKD